MQKTLDRFNNVNLLRFRQFRIDRQCESLASSAFRFRKLTFLVTEMEETLLPVKWNRIVNLCTHAVRLQMFHKSIAPFRDANHVLMKDVTRAWSNMRRDDWKV